MEAFTVLTGIAAPLPLINVDTDMIIPKQYLRSIERTGFGVNLFDEMRYTPDGDENPDFVLNQDPYRKAKILVTGKNFGCGSSREHAPWALLDFGIRCVIAPSFADIFYNNCFKNGILPIVLAQDEVDRLMAAAAAGQTLTVNLQAQTIEWAQGTCLAFDLDPARKTRLMEGLDDIALTLTHEATILDYENKRAKTLPWV